MNLLYKGCQMGCYNGAVNNVISGYTYGGGHTVASYYADLQPNTTYTLSKTDMSNRFRVATYTKDVKFLIGAGSENDSLTQKWLIDSETSLTFTTGDYDIYLVVYYTSNSEYDTRIMLNEGSTAEAYEAPSIILPSTWYIGQDGTPTRNIFPPLPESFVSQPYPAQLWRINNGKLTHMLLSETKAVGAFANATNLSKVSIPRSVKHIGREAFRNTRITSVTIASDCVYYPTSFPDGCIVHFYPDN